MKSFNTYINEQINLNEKIMRKGTVSAYGMKSKTYGNKAKHQYQLAKQSLNIRNNKIDAVDKIDLLLTAFIKLMDGLINTREQIGSISAQITAATLLK